MNSKRVAKNTAVLYFRMLFQMVVYLYTSRVVLEALGEKDYGIYDVVGGIVGVIVFLNNSLSVATQRFITYALGTGDASQVSRSFSASVLVHVLMAVFIVLVGETLGLWYVFHHVVCPVERFDAMLWAYHFSLASAVVLVLSVPYNALIIAHERMTAFACITIVDVCLKLAVVLGLAYVQECRLQIYVILLFVEACVIRIIYALYCKYGFKQVKFSVHGVGRPMFSSMLKFAGWSTFGNFALACNVQGLNLLLNTVGGPVLNAARAVAFQAQTAVVSFIASFQTAINPQITKSYASGRVDQMNDLILRSCKFSFFLMLFMVIPLMLETDYVFSLWLKQVPEYAVSFARMMFCVAMVDSISNGLMVGATATGDIKRYHITIGFTLLLSLPLAWLFMRWGFSPVMVFVAQFVVYIAAQVVRCFLCRRLFGFNIRAYMSRVLRPVVFVTLFSVFIPFALCWMMEQGLLRLILVTLTGGISVLTAIFVVGLQDDEKQFVKSYIQSKIRR